MIVAHVSAAPVQHVVIHLKLVVLAFANVEQPQLVSVKHLDLTAMLQITYVNVPQV